jgi:hypothetical protein
VLGIPIIADFLVVLIPIPIVLKLSLPRFQRIIVALLLGAGFTVCFAGIARTVYMYRLTETYYDVTWDAFPMWLSAAVKLYIGIVRTFHCPVVPSFAMQKPGCAIFMHLFSKFSSYKVARILTAHCAGLHLHTPYKTYQNT